MLFLFEEEGNTLLFLKVAWELDDNDYQRFDRELRELTGTYVSIRMLVMLDGFRTPDPATFWKRMGLDMQYTDEIERIAFVSDYKDFSAGTKVGTSGAVDRSKVKFFQLRELEKARRWVSTVETCNVPAFHEPELAGA